MRIMIASEGKKALERVAVERQERNAVCRLKGESQMERPGKGRSVKGGRYGRASMEGAHGGVWENESEQARTGLCQGEREKKVTSRVFARSTEKGTKHMCLSLVGAEQHTVSVRNFIDGQTRHRQWPSNHLPGGT